MIFVKHTPSKQTNASWPVITSKAENTAAYWPADRLRALDKNIVRDTRHLREMLEQVPDGQPLAPHALHAKYSGRERVLGCDLRASQRLTQEGNRRIDRMRQRLVTEYLITDVPGQTTQVDLTVHVDTLSDADQAFGFKGSFANAQCSVRVKLPDGSIKTVASKTESRVRAADAVGAGGGLQAGPVGGSASASVPNMAPDGPDDDPKTEIFSFEVTKFPARIQLRSNFRLNAVNFADFNLAISRAFVDHELTITQGNLVFQKDFAQYSLETEPDPHGGAISGGTITNPVGEQPPVGFVPAGGTPEREVDKGETLPSPGGVRIARLVDTPSPELETALAALNANPELFGRNLARAIEEGEMPLELARELFES